MAVAGKSRIFPGLGYNYNKKKKTFLQSQRERSLSPSLGYRYDISDMKAVYQSVFVNVSENWWVSLTLSVTGQKFSPIFKHGNDCLHMKGNSANGCDTSADKHDVEFGDW